VALSNIWRRGRPVATNFARLSYVGAFGAGDKALALQAGVYVDDIDAVVLRRMIWAGIAGIGRAGHRGIRGVLAWPRPGRPLNRTCSAMDELAKGNLAVDIPFVDQTNEVGRIARSLQIFKDHLVETTRLRTEQEEMKVRSAEERRTDLSRIADDFEQHRRGDPGHRHRRRRAAGFGFVDVHDRGGDDGSERQGGGRGRADRIERSDRCGFGGGAVVLDPGDLAAGHPVFVNCPERGRAGRPTEAMVGRLVEASQKIGEVMALIQTIAGQTNLLALNADHRGRPGRRRRQGFAVVANEVKALSSQTAKATDEITSQIQEIRDATGSTVNAIREIGTTIGQMNEITGSIAAAVEEQGAATNEIARSVQQAAQGAQEVMQNITGVREASSKVNAAATLVLNAQPSSPRNPSSSRAETGKFLGNIRAA
jgi:Methyl-accepting chemotaxis protein